MQTNQIMYNVYKSNVEENSQHKAQDFCKNNCLGCHCTDHLVPAVPHWAALAPDNGGRAESLRGLRGEVQRESEDQVTRGVTRGEPHPDPALAIITHGQAHQAQAGEAHDVPDGVGAFIDNSKATVNHFVKSREFSNIWNFCGFS